MGMIGMGNDCYLYVNGISAPKPIWLHDTVCLSPAKSAIKWQEVMSLFENDIDFSIAVLCNPTIASQLHIIGDDTEQLIANAWNSQWDCVLLGALFNHNVMCNLQSDQPIEQIAKAKYVHITNYELRALLSDIYYISEEDELWLEKYYNKAYKLLEGARGTTPAQMEQIQETLLRLSQLVTDYPFIDELDINPLLISEKTGGIFVTPKLKTPLLISPNKFIFK